MSTAAPFAGRGRGSPSGDCCDGLIDDGRIGGGTTGGSEPGGTLVGGGGTALTDGTCGGGIAGSDGRREGGGTTGGKTLVLVDGGSGGGSEPGVVPFGRGGGGNGEGTPEGSVTAWFGGGGRALTPPTRVRDRCGVEGGASVEPVVRGDFFASPSNTSRSLPPLLSAMFENSSRHAAPFAAASGKTIAHAPRDARNIDEQALFAGKPG